MLSPREAQVLAMLAAGAELHVAARELGIAPATARSHLSRAVRKLGLRTREEAVALAAVLVSPGPAPAAASEPTPAPPPGTRPSTPAGGPVRTAAGDTRQARGPADPQEAARPPEALWGAGWTPGRARAPKDSNGILFDPLDGPPRLVFTDFDSLCAITHTRLVQQTFLLTGCRHRAVHIVHLALGAAGRRWQQVSRLPDPERWVRAHAFETALSPWRRGGPRRANRLWQLPRPRIKVHPAGRDRQVDPEQERLTSRDRALLKALRRLSRPQRRALVLHDALGLPVAQVAAEVESSTAAAENRVRGARAALVRSVPDLVGRDPSAPGFGEQLAALLHRAAVHGCPSPRRPSALRLRVQTRLRSGLQAASAGLVVLVVGGAIVVVATGYSPSRLMRPPAPVPPPLCTRPGSGSAGPLLPGGEPGLRTVWCGPTPGRPLPLVAPPPLRVRPPRTMPAPGLGPRRPAPGATGGPGTSSAEEVPQPGLPVTVPTALCDGLRLCPAASPAKPPLPIWPTAWEE